MGYLFYSPIPIFSSPKMELQEPVIYLPLPPAPWTMVGIFASFPHLFLLDNGTSYVSGSEYIPHCLMDISKSVSWAKTCWIQRPFWPPHFWSFRISIWHPSPLSPILTKQRHFYPNHQHLHPSAHRIELTLDLTHCWRYSEVSVYTLRVLFPHILWLSLKASPSPQQNTQ